MNWLKNMLGRLMAGPPAPPLHPRGVIPQTVYRPPTVYEKQQWGAPDSATAAANTLPYGNWHGREIQGTFDPADPLTLVIGHWEGQTNVDKNRGTGVIGGNPVGGKSYSGQTRGR